MVNPRSCVPLYIDITRAHTRDAPPAAALIALILAGRRPGAAMVAKVRLVRLSTGEADDGVLGQEL
jgi:hypothetical protein